MPSSKNSSDGHHLQITQHDKFYSRLLSKEASLSNPSFRIYYGGGGAVPFTWESQPGTPKDNTDTNTLPPLTPPPSYHFTSKKKTRHTNKSHLIHCLFPARLTSKKHNLLPPSPAASLSSSSASSSRSSSGSAGSHRRSRFSSPQSSFSSKADDEELVNGESPTSTLCYGNGELRGCYSMVIMKNALLSIVGHGSSQGTAA